MRPVMSERASACCCETRASRGMKKASAPKYSTSQTPNGISIRGLNCPTMAIRVTKYTTTKTMISPRILHISRTASAVCITLADTRPENSS